MLGEYKHVLGGLGGLNRNTYIAYGLRGGLEVKCLCSYTLYIYIMCLINYEYFDLCINKLSVYQ